MTAPRDLGRFTTLPNFMSILRIVLVPFLGAALRAPDADAARPAVLGLLALAFVTDWFDGRIARWTRQESGWGAVLDPLADKVFVAGTGVFLVAYRGFPLWLLALIAARDLAIVACAGLMMRRVRAIPHSDAIGRTAMCVFSLALLAFAVPIPAAQTPLVWASVAFVALSVASYARTFRALARGASGASGVRGGGAGGGAGAEVAGR
jgi:CDP-diacylglycerol--glycerol-3-phosphate 3-phosphatidyltransferase